VQLTSCISMGQEARAKVVTQDPLANLKVYKKYHGIDLKDEDTLKSLQDTMLVEFREEAIQKPSIAVNPEKQDFKKCKLCERIVQGTSEYCCTHGAQKKKVCQHHDMQSSMLLTKNGQL